MRDDMKKRLEKLNRVPLYITQKRKINKLEREIESLQETIKNDLYVSFMERLNENYEVERLRKENRNLRLKVRELKRQISIQTQNKKARKSK
jgi:hypothetical protein